MSFITYIQNILYRFSTSPIHTYYKPCCCKTKKNKRSVLHNESSIKRRSTHKRRSRVNKKYSKRKY